MNESTASIRKAYRPELTILVVEDHIVFSREIKHALASHNVVFAQTLEEARARYNECMPDITFLDIDLPDGNGLELIDFVRAQASDAYIVMLTGSKLEEDIAASRGKGADGYIIKPFTRRRIERAVENYLDIRETDIKQLIADTQIRRKKAVKNQEE